MSSLGPPPAPATTFLPSKALHKRVRAINAEGLEEHAEDNPWIHMQLKDPFQQVGEAHTPAAQHSTTVACSSGPAHACTNGNNHARRDLSNGNAPDSCACMVSLNRSGLTAVDPQLYI